MSESGLEKFVDAQPMGRLLILSAHLWLEHVLVRCLSAVLPNPDALFARRTVSFSMLVSLCEAHQVIEPSVADTLRAVNTVRNKCAHEADHLQYSSAIEQVRVAFGRIGLTDEDKQAIDKATNPHDPLGLIGVLMEVRANKIGATDLDPVSIRPLAGS